MGLFHIAPLLTNMRLYSGLAIITLFLCMEGITMEAHPEFYLKVPVAIYGDETGEVWTAFLSKHISGNIDERGLKYVKSRL